MRKIVISAVRSAVSAGLIGAGHNQRTLLAFKGCHFPCFSTLEFERYSSAGCVGAWACDYASFLAQPTRSRSYSTAPRASTKNYYKILGISSKATQAQIKDAYYRQSMKHHPDKHKGSDKAHELFQEITEAYSILGNHDLRKQYDRGLIVSGEITMDQTGVRQSPPKPSGSIYDFDEWTKQHYFEALKRKQRSKREMAEEERERNSQKLRVGSQRWIIFSVFSLVVVAFVFERRVRDTDESTTER